MDVGPVELIVLSFPAQQADPAAISVLASAVSRGYVSVLDVVFVRRTPDGMLRVSDGSDNLDDAGLGPLQIQPRQPLISESDLTLVGGQLKAGTSAVVIVYEHRWTRHLASAVAQAGGAVALHAQLPPDAVAAAVS
jgi:hypothetical protein